MFYLKYRGCTHENTTVLVSFKWLIRFLSHMDDTWGRYFASGMAAKMYVRENKRRRGGANFSLTGF